jgi:hypothetical protein
LQYARECVRPLNGIAAADELIHLNQQFCLHRPGIQTPAASGATFDKEFLRFLLQTFLQSKSTPHHIMTPPPGLFGLVLILLGLGVLIGFYL